MNRYVGFFDLVLLASTVSLPRELGRAKAKTKFRGLLSTNRAVNVLSAARFFLFGARDIWFVVGLPVFLSSSLGFSFASVGSFLALWVIGYGVVQTVAPAVVGWFTNGVAPQGRSARVLAFLLASLTGLMALGLLAGYSPYPIVLGGLAIFGVVFALNSSVHSYLILSYSERDEVAQSVGFYYMANAAGRLVGTVLSGVLFQLAGLNGCLWGAASFAAAAGLLSMLLPHERTAMLLTSMHIEGGSD